MIQINFTSFQMSSNAEFLRGLFSKEGESLLHKATKKGSIAEVQILIDRGFDVNSVDVGGRSSLHWAIFHRHFSIAQTLIKNGANVKAKTNELDTVLHWAAGTIQCLKTGFFPIQLKKGP